MASPPDGCAPPKASPPRQSIILAKRGNCTFIHKAQVAAELDAVGLIIINNSTDCIYPEMEANETQALAHMFIASSPFDDEAKALMQAATRGAAAAGSPPQATYSSIHTVTLDPAALVLLALAVVTIIAGAAWAGSEYKRALAVREEEASLNASSEGHLHGANGQEGVMLLNAAIRCR